MDRLSILISIMTGAVIGGACIITAFALGFYSVYAIVAAVVITLLLSWPAAYVLSRRIKKEDPNWNREAKPRAIPDPSAPEV